jgi:hypothetical protein
VSEDWREEALAEIRSIKSAWACRYRWDPKVEPRDAGPIDLYVHFCRAAPEEGRAPTLYVLRLRYESDFKTAGRREAFVNPENLEEEGTQYWPTGVRAINTGTTPHFICPEGTYGFHSVHHRERDGRAAYINKLLMEIQQCLDH